MTEDRIGSRRKRWIAALTASVACHVLFAMYVTFQQERTPLPKRERSQVMDVVLLNPEVTQKQAPPDEADAISNLSAKGSSSNAQDRTTRAARSPLAGPVRQKPKPALPRQPRTPPPAPEPTPQQRTRTMARRGPSPDASYPEPPRKRPKQKLPQQPPVPLSNLMPSSMALAELSRDFDRERRLKKMLTREADVPINTREAKFAPYAQHLVRLLEEQWRPGNANYRKFSDLERRALLKLTIEHDGSLGNVEILRPSPIAQINESAVAAIHAATPFRPLPSVWGLDRVSFYLTFEVIEDRFVFRAL